ncbi:MAG TPA: trypsin-like peptidase domain-containing protein [Vicinamibacterales bacterium]|nr:trypsin-like peptidase domain-containing protein [Vicinamibacterales bacterium]
MRGAARFWSSLGLLIFAAGVVLSPQDKPPHEPPSASSRLTGAAPSESSVVPMDTNLFRTVARRLNPAVVAIMTAAWVESPNPEDTEWFERFFGQPRQSQAHTRHEVASGFLINRDGDILTNDHVVANAYLIEVRLLGKETTTYRARLVGRDPISDSALLRLQDAPGDLPFATLGDSDALETGDWVMAIGNPFELGHTVTVGVVSHQSRPFEVDEGRWQKLIQTDASINPGNSGGPLVNVRGDIIGINAAMLADGIGATNGIGFAVPINSVKALLPQLRAGKVVRGRIGVRFRGKLITNEDARALRLPSASGALITSVERDSTAARAGLRAGDVVIDFSGTPVASADDVIGRIASTPPDSRAQMTIVRDGRTRNVSVGIEELALSTPTRGEARVEDASDFGLTLADLTESATDRIRPTADIGGSLVQAVQDESPGAEAGIEEGDIVRKVNGRPVHTTVDAIRELQRIHGRRPAFLLVLRDGDELLVEMKRD